MDSVLVFYCFNHSLENFATELMSQINGKILIRTIDYHS